MNDNNGDNQPPTARALRIAGSFRFWAEQGLTTEQMDSKLSLQYPDATPHEIEHGALLAQVAIIADEEAANANG